MESVNVARSLDFYDKNALVLPARNAPGGLAIVSAYSKFKCLDVIKNWYKEVRTGIPLGKNNSALLYRNWEIQFRGNTKERITRLKMAQLSLLKYIKGENGRCLRIPKDFPIEIPK